MAYSHYTGPGPVQGMLSSQWVLVPFLCLGTVWTCLHNDLFTLADPNSDSDLDLDSKPYCYIVLFRTFQIGSDSDPDPYSDGFPNGYCAHFTTYISIRGSESESEPMWNFCVLQESESLSRDPSPDPPMWISHNILEPIDPGTQSRYRTVWIYHNSVHCYLGASLPMICLSGISVWDEWRWRCKLYIFCTLILCNELR